MVILFGREKLKEESLGHVINYFFEKKKGGPLTKHKVKPNIEKADKCSEIQWHCNSAGTAQSTFFFLLLLYFLPDTVSASLHSSSYTSGRRIIISRTWPPHLNF